MQLPTSIENSLIHFMNPKITFCKNTNEYLLNKKNLIDIDKEYFHLDSTAIIKDINGHLSIGRNNKEFINYLKLIINKKYDWFEDNKLYDLKTIDKMETKINKEETCNSEIIPYQFIEMDDLISKSENNEDFVIHIERFIEKTDNFKDPLSFQKARLLFSLTQLKESLDSIYDYLYKLEMDYDSIDFTHFNYNQYMISNGFTDEVKNDIYNERANFNLSKLDVANLFYILKEEKLLLFEKNQRNNDAKINRFIEQNFTYKDKNENTTIIKNINKEFSKITNPNNKQLQIDYITKLITMLEIRKSYLEQ